MGLLPVFCSTFCCATALKQKPKNSIQMNEQKEANNTDKDKESIQQQPAQEKQKGIYTPEPPQVKDPRRLPDADKASEVEGEQEDDQQADASRER
jgi:hypothetical protein